MIEHHLNPGTPASFILLKNGKVYQRSTAALIVAGQLNGGWRLLYPLLIIPPFLRDPLYELIARNRYKWFGKTDLCWLPKPEFADRFIS